MERRPDQPPAEPQDVQWYRMAGLGLEFVVAILAMAGIGWWIDRSAGTSPWCLIAGCGLGFAVGLYILFKAAKSSFR